MPSIFASLQIIKQCIIEEKEETLGNATEEGSLFMQYMHCVIIDKNTNSIIVKLGYVILACISYQLDK